MYVAFVMALGAIPVFQALAFIVVVDEMVIGLEYVVDDSVGVVPSRV